MKKTNKPLFIIDTSRSHGRGRETDWISCTSTTTPFVASCIMIDNNEYLESYNPDDEKTVYSYERNGIRMRVRVTNIADGYNKTELRTLLRKAMKEVLERRSRMVISPDATKEDCISFLEAMQEQNRENLKEEPKQWLHVTVGKILVTIREKLDGLDF